MILDLTYHISVIVLVIIEYCGVSETVFRILAVAVVL